MVGFMLKWGLVAVTMKVCACSAVVEEVVVCCACWLVGVVLNDITRGCCTVVVVDPVCVVDSTCVVDIVCVVDTVDGDKTRYYFEYGDGFILPRLWARPIRRVHRTLLKNSQR